MSLTRKASSAAKKPTKPPRQDLAQALAEREAELAEARSQQAATAEILKVISLAPTDSRPALERIVVAAVRLLRCDMAAVLVREGAAYIHAAGATPEGPMDLAPERFPIDASANFPSRVFLGKTMLHLPDWSRLDLPEHERHIRQRFGVNSALFLPLGRGDECIGVLVAIGRRTNAFGPGAIAHAESFRDQALIAIENGRLLRETQEALEQQKASADVLSVIGRSVSDAAPVFESILDACQRLFGSDEVGVYSIGDDDMVRVAAWRGPRAEEVKRDVTPLAESVTGRTIRERRTHHIPDLRAEPDLSPTVRERVERLGSASLLYAPMLVEDRGLGSILVARSPPRPFSEREQALLQSFADQAAIAIENARLFDEVQARTREVEEALAQQTATADVLKVISRSAFDLQPVLDTLVESAARLCDTEMAFILRRDGEVFRAGAAVGHSPEYMEYLQSHPINIDRGSVTGRVALLGRVVQILDVRVDPEYTLTQTTSLTGQRTALGVPLIRDGEVIGVIVLGRRRVEPFTARQIELVETFADQAVIAISNVGLFNEIQESLAQQTATADVLKVISGTAFDLQAVLDTLAASAAGLIGANFAVMYLRRGDAIVPDATFGCSPELVEFLAKNPQRPGRETVAGRVFLHGQAQTIPDVLEDKEYAYGDAPRLGNFRALLGAPLFRDGKVEGSFTLGRAQPGPFTQRQIELVQTFADQAVIAIENARLFGEVQARTKDLQEALQQQTATADVLKVISRSAFDVKAVLNSLTTSAVELCNATYGAISLYRDGVLKFMAQTGCTLEFSELLWSHPATLDRKSVTGRTGLLRSVVVVPDVLQDKEYDYHGGEIIGNYRSMLGVPLLRNGELEGVFTLMRAEPGTFTQRQIELVQTFADQAVIAIENVRLFNEVQARTRDLSEALQLQTATSEVLKVISRSAFDLQAVFDTLISSAVELCGAFSGSICVRDGDVFRYTGSAGVGAIPALHEYLAKHPATPGRGTMVGRVLLSGKVEHIRDRLEDKEYAVPTATFGNTSRAFLGVPLLGKAGIDGALVLTREEPGHFSDRQIEIVQTFADQAVIAIENARLFGEVQARTRELAASLDDLRKAQDRLIQSEKLASLGQLTAGIAHEIKNPLNFVNNFSALSRELVGELADVIKSAPFDVARREEAEELIQTIGGNLDKVVQHGSRADSIVKNMLLHSREGSGERSTTKVNAMVEEALNLAYHGARAEKPGFNVTIVKSLDPNAGAAEVYTQEMTRVLLNLISNGFYATAKRKLAEPDGAYEPTLTASTRDLGSSVEIAIRDNGIGISDEVKAKMFNPFFTTKPAGEGTGLGLSLSHDIVVKQHGGTLDVSTEPGSYTEFTIALPRAGAKA